MVNKKTTPEGNHIKMGATKPEKADKKEKKEKKDKKRSEADGVSKSSSSKKDKKEKKEKKEKLKNAVSTALDAQLENGGGDVTTLAIIKADKDDDKTKTATVLKPVVGALVPFARPLADEKGTKKIMKSVRKGMYSHLPLPPQAFDCYPYILYSYIPSHPLPPEISSHDTTALDDSDSTLGETEACPFQIPPPLRYISPPPTRGP